MSKVLIVGSTALDSVKTPFGDYENILGGSAIHASVSASFFAPVNIVGVVGDDFPKEHIEMLHAHKIDTTGLQIIKGGKTFHWKGYYEKEMNHAHTIDTQLNVFADFKPTIPNSYKKTPFIFLANIDPDLQLSVLEQMEKPKLTLLDSMNLWIDIKKDQLTKVMSKVDVVLLNEGEIRQYTGISNLIKAAQEIQKLGMKTLIIKKGEHGALMFNKDKIFATSSFPVSSVKDPTGAGDSFAGGFIGYLAKTGDISEKNMRQAVIVGTTMASYIVEDFSCNRFLKLKKEDITQRFSKLQNLCQFEKLSF
ncbi:MAG: sugar kinase [Candidatus Margulisbacteria bacterium]|nr:sugar kinase [Candidatus Margulisiibacteriota bacterium]